MEAGAVGWDGHAPGECGGEAGVAAFGEVAESEEGPGEGRAGSPGVEGVEERKVAEAEVDCGRDDGQDEAGGG